METIDYILVYIGLIFAATVSIACLGFVVREILVSTKTWLVWANEIKELSREYVIIRRIRQRRKVKGAINPASSSSQQDPSKTD